LAQGTLHGWSSSSGDRVKPLSVSFGDAETFRIGTARSTEALLSDKTIFWIVKPQLFAGNLSGLDTLLSGSYIGLLPSAANGKAERHFAGSPDPPILTTEVPRTTFRLETGKLGAISPRSPIFYRGLDVGTVVLTKYSIRAAGAMLTGRIR
jgi:paraquat-inducible protein B